MTTITKLVSDWVEKGAINCSDNNIECSVVATVLSDGKFDKSEEINLRKTDDGAKIADELRLSQNAGPDGLNALRRSITLWSNGAVPANKRDEFIKRLETFLSSVKSFSTKAFAFKTLFEIMKAPNGDKYRAKIEKIFGKYSLKEILPQLEKTQSKKVAERIAAYRAIGDFIYDDEKPDSERNRNIAILALSLLRNETSDIVIATALSSVGGMRHLGYVKDPTGEIFSLIKYFADSSSPSVKTTAIYCLGMDTSRRFVNNVQKNEVLNILKAAEDKKNHSIVRLFAVWIIAHLMGHMGKRRAEFMQVLKDTASDNTQISGDIKLPPRIGFRVEMFAIVEDPNDTRKSKIGTIGEVAKDWLRKL